MPPAKSHETLTLRQNVFMICTSTPHLDLLSDLYNDNIVILLLICIQLKTHLKQSNKVSFPWIMTIVNINTRYIYCDSGSKHFLWILNRVH